MIELKKDHKELQIAFSYPSYGSVTDQFFHSVMAMTLYELSKSNTGEELQNYRHLGSFLWQDPSCYVSVNRTKACMDLISSPAEDTHILMIDTDISFPPNILDYIVAHLAAYPEVEILAGRANIRNGYPVFFKKEFGVITQQIQPFLGVKEFDFVGTGIIIISKEAYKDLTQKVGHPSLFMHRLDENNREYGDDLSFCEVARNNGYKLWGSWRIFGTHWKLQPIKSSYPETVEAVAPVFKAKTSNEG